MGIAKFILKISVQTAVYWGNPVEDGYGKLTFDGPVEIPVRWENTATLITASDGEQYVTQAEILVNQDVDVNGYLYLGTLDDFDSAEGESPKEITGAHRIRRFDKVPMIKSTTIFVRKAYI